jgi:hypothetical protein
MFVSLNSSEGQHGMSNGLYKGQHKGPVGRSDGQEGGAIYKILVFDMDETLGHFVELSMFLDALNDFYNKKVENTHFFKILDLFPEFIRPNMVKILKYINNKRHRKHCNKIIIYTNNQGQKSWAERIASYFEYRVNKRNNVSVEKKTLFDTIIAAYKIGGKQIEADRSTHDKTVPDLIRCSKINENTKICFLDDQYHPLMEDKNVYYINCKPYVYNLSFEEMAERYFNKFSEMVIIEKSIFVKQIKTFMNMYKFTVVPKQLDDYNMDKFVSRDMFRHIRLFLSNKGMKTRRKRINEKTRTLKKRHH